MGIASWPDYLEETQMILEERPRPQAHSQFQRAILKNWEWAWGQG